MKRHLSGYPLWNQAALPPGSIVVADELLPSEALELFSSGVVAIVSEQGGEIQSYGYRRTVNEDSRSLWD